MTTLRWKIIAASVATVALMAPVAWAAPNTGITPSNPGITAQAHQGVWITLGDSNEQVRQVQYVLRSYGYAVDVDGVFGQQTLAAVTHWQEANGLLADGIVGPVTWASLGVAEDTSASVAPAPVVTPVSQPQPQVSHSGRCPQFEGLLRLHNMPVEYFSYVTWRETGGTCNPNAYNGRHNDRSYGLLQINTKGALWGELQRRCGLRSKDQLFDPATNIACGASLYQAYGTTPWRTS